MPKVIECFGCDEKFVTTSAMILHLESGYCRCQIYCEDINLLTLEYYQAERYTTGFVDKPFRCEDCNGHYSLMSALLQHVETVKEMRRMIDRLVNSCLFWNCRFEAAGVGHEGYVLFALGSPSVLVQGNNNGITRFRIFRLTFLSYLQILRPRKSGRSPFHAPCNFLPPGLVVPPIYATGSSSVWVGKITNWRLGLPELQMDERRKGDRLQSVVGICVDCRSSSLPVPPLLTIGIFSTTLTQHTCPL